MYSWKVVSILIGPSFGLARQQWIQSGTNAAPDRIAIRHLLHLRLPCIAQVTPRYMTTTRAESVRGVRLHPWTTIEAVDPRGMTRRSRSDASAVAAAPDRPLYALTDGPGPTTETGIAIERDHASTPEETDRDRDRVEGPARETRDEVAVVIAAEIGIGTERVAGTIPEQLPTNPMPWMNMEKEQGR